MGSYERNYWEQKIHQCPSSQFYHGKKQRNIRQKEIPEIFYNYFVNIGPNLSASIPESKTTFQNYIHYGGPCLSTINFTDLELKKCICPPQNKQKFRV